MPQLSHSRSVFLSLSLKKSHKQKKVAFYKNFSSLPYSLLLSFSLPLSVSLLHTKHCVRQVQFLDSLPEDKQVINYIPSFFLFAGLQTPSKCSPGVSPYTQTKGFQDYLMSRLLFLNGMPWCDIEKNFKRPTFIYTENYAVKNSTIATHNKVHAEVHTLSKFCKHFHDLLCKSLVNGL